MSKNVAVFVDVANIFYAAKAAGADIDYVTLLKSAIAGRDFVRAYAYTGLDPENENQRQFHSFLARNGYKVVSKDIRKYGDGRIKANLDIELVVDLMRMARNLDIAVVVSGDGDFAPAIRAVQQMGVRVEVISFRGNTSSDLIEVADAFIDIAQVARVDKDSGRSGRRVAAEGDLSMTAVPEKETEGAPRRRRGRARDGEREARVAADTTTGLVALPGERLSRVPDEADEATAEAEAEVPATAADLESEDGEAPRRRRRRGGRGRGRGRRSEELVGTPVGAEGEEDDEDDFEEVLPPPPPHQTFGSVWDSQLGVPTPPLSSAAPSATPAAFEEDEEDVEEPEIPEYLLAERRQRQHGQRGRMGRGRGAYQAALDRERFGRSAAGPAAGGPGFGGGRGGDRRPDRGRGGRPPQRGDQHRGDRQPSRQPERERTPSAPRPSGDPWSEVPPELEEMLRAELSRKGGRPPGEAPAAEQPTSTVGPSRDAVLEAGEAAAEEPKQKRAGRPRATRAQPASTAAPADAISAADTTEAKPKRAPRTRAPKAESKESEPSPPAAEVTEAKPKRTVRRTTKGTAAPADPTLADGAEAAAAQAAEAKPVRRRRTKQDEPSTE